MRPIPAAAAALFLALAVSAEPARAALCGDTTGDGYFTASDALATLKLAVTSGYDRRGDVVPAGGNDKISAADALETLKGAIEGRIPRCSSPVAAHVAVTTAAYDFFSSGGFAVGDIASRTFESRPGAVSGDAVIRVSRGVPIVVNRKNFNSLQVLDWSDEDLPTIKECSVSDGIDSNPQDVLLLSEEKGYVTPYADDQLYVIAPPVLFDPKLDPACSSFITGRIDLSEFDSDGFPQMDQMLAIGSDLFVTLQLLDEALQPDGPGTIVVIDTLTDTVKGSIDLSLANPFAQTKGLVWDEFQQRIFIGGPGKTGDTLDDGGIESVDPVSMQSDGMLLTGADIDANIYDFVIVGTRRVFAVISFTIIESNTVIELNSVVDIDLADRSVRKTLLTSAALITDIEMTEQGELWVAYRGEATDDPPGLRIFPVIGGPELTKTPIDLGQAPFTLAFFE